MPTLACRHTFCVLPHALLLHYRTPFLEDVTGSPAALVWWLWFYRVPRLRRVPLPIYHALLVPAQTFWTIYWRRADRDVVREGNIFTSLYFLPSLCFSILFTSSAVYV
jgi:hypothetical protein